MRLVESIQQAGFQGQKLFTLLDLCVSSLRRGHANLLCIVPILTDDPGRESNDRCLAKYRLFRDSYPETGTANCGQIEPVSHFTTLPVAAPVAVPVAWQTALKHLGKRL